MIRVAFDFRRATFMAFHEQADGIRTKRHGRGIKLWLAGDQSIGLLDVRYDVLFRCATAAGEACKRQRCRHQLQEIAPVDGVIPLRRRLSWKFAMQQLFKLRITGELLERAPILLAGFRLQPCTHRGQIQRAFIQLCIFTRPSMIVLATGVFVLLVFAHTVHF